MTDCVVLYSGGTDSTCAAALMAERHDRIHLLTFDERGTRSSPTPSANIQALRGRFGADRIVHRSLDVDPLVRRLSYERYGRLLMRHGFFMLSTPAFSSLSWHLRALAYCLDHGVSVIADGLTRELLHFPGHMDPVINRLRDFHAEFGVSYENPVRSWPVPPEQEILDRVIVGRHGFADLGGAPPIGTTGTYLFERGLMPHPNVKGSALDQGMQHDCYPFVLYNIFVFWLCLPFQTREAFERRMTALIEDKLAVARGWVRERRRHPELFG